MEFCIEKTEKNEKEILEMILQFCYENKYIQTAKLIESKTSIIYDQNEIQELKYLLKEHEFEKSIQFLEKSNFENLQKTEVLKIIKSRKLIELIKNSNFHEALEYIRKELSPLLKNSTIMNKFSILLFIKDKDYLERYLRQNFNDISVDETLIFKVQNLLCLSLDSNGNRILPNSRLENLLNKYYNLILNQNMLDVNNYNIDSQIQLQKSNKIEENGYDIMDIDTEIKIDKNLNEIFDSYNKGNNYNLENNIKYFSFEQIYIIEKHDDEIWHIEFSPKNNFFATCSRNGNISIFKIEYNKKQQKSLDNIKINQNNNTNIQNNINSYGNFKKKILEKNQNNFDSTEINKNLNNPNPQNILTDLYITCINSFLAHKKSVTSISWSKNEKNLLTSSISKEIFLWDPFEGVCQKKFYSHTDIVTTVKWINDDMFVSGSIDKKMRIESLEKGLICSETFSRIRRVLISEHYNCIIILPSSMNDIVFYDYKNFKEMNRLTEMDPIISANISKKDEGMHLIVNLSKVNASINLYEISNLKLINKFYGHSQEQYSIECGFAGELDEFIICGSEDASIYIWHISDSIPLRVIKGHTGSINSCNLFKLLDKNIIFSASDDHTIRIWADSIINVEYCDSSNSSKKNTSGLNNTKQLHPNTTIFDVINTSNWGIHNNDISLNDDSRSQSSELLIEEDD